MFFAWVILLIINNTLNVLEIIFYQLQIFFSPHKRQLAKSCLSVFLFLNVALKHVTFHVGFVRVKSSICSEFLDLSEWYCRKSILALVDGQPWDMYKPLTKSCEIKFLTFKDDDPGEVNKVFLPLHSFVLIPLVFLPPFIKICLLWSMLVLCYVALVLFDSL